MGLGKPGVDGYLRSTIHQSIAVAMSQICIYDTTYYLVRFVD